MTLPLQQMSRDAEAVQAALDCGVEHFVGPAAEQIGDLCCHVQALVGEVQDQAKELKAYRTIIKKIQKKCGEYWIISDEARELGWLIESMKECK